MWQWEKVQTQVQNLKKQLFVLWLSISILTSIISRSVLYFNMPFWIYLPSLLSSMYFYFGFDLTVLIVLWHINGFTVCACKTLKHFNLNIKTFIDVLLFCFFFCSICRTPPSWFWPTNKTSRARWRRQRSLSASPSTPSPRTRGTSRPAAPWQEKGEPSAPRTLSFPSATVT